MSLLASIARRIGNATSEPFTPDGQQTVSGGCINEALVLTGGARRYFVKLNDATRLPMFEAESEGLAAIAATGTVRVPQPVTTGVAQGRAFLVLEYLELCGTGGDEALGRALATMHRHTAPRFGWHRDNILGSTSQPNAWSEDWVSFLRERRIGYQLGLAARNGADGNLLRQGEALLARLADLFTGNMPQPSLLHGDLWGGNAGVMRSGEPVIFDPAVYFGDRAADLAMTELFGGFSPRFYAAYREVWPLAPEYAVHKDLYNLYHVLNHYNLFGGGYARQAEVMMGRLLAQIR